MERFREIIEALTNDHRMLSVLHFIPIALFSIGSPNKRQGEPDILGDNVPYTITDQIKRLGPRG